MAISRSENMRRIRGKDTGPEVALREALGALGLVPADDPGFAPEGRPDLVFLDARVAVFVDGCQWHGCPDHYVRPRTREDFWSRKLAANVERDRRQALALRSAGWTVLRIWEHELRGGVASAAERVVRVVDGQLEDGQPDYRVDRVEVIDPVCDLERRHLTDLNGRGPAHAVERRRWTGKRGHPPA